MNRHLVDELVFDIAIDSRIPAMRDEAWLSRLVTGALLPVVEQVFDAMDDGETVLVLPSLEIDLGDIAQAEYEETAVRRLRAGLEDALQQALADARRTRGAGAVAANAVRDENLPRLVGRGDAALARLAHFLASGTMPWHADIKQPHLHEALLGELLARGGAGLLAVLARALADPHSARRLAGQFPERQLLAVLRAMAGAHAPAFEALLAELEQSRPAVCARIRAALGPSAGARADIDVLAHFLDSAVVDLAPDGADLPLHQTLLARLLRLGGDSLRAVLARALAYPHSARRLAEQFPAHQLLAALRIVAGADAEPVEALLAKAKQWNDGAATARVLEQAWSQVLAERAGAGQQTEPDLSDVDALALFLDSGVLRLAVDGAEVPAHQALLDRLLDRGGDALRAVLASAFAQPHSARRFVEQFSHHQVLTVLRRLAGKQAAWFESLLEESAQGAASAPAAIWVEVLAASAGAGDAAAAQAACARIRAAHFGAASQAGLASDCAALAAFLDNGQLQAEPRLAGTLPAHALLLERLLAHGHAGLWPVLSRALADPQSARRLVDAFPEHQLKAMLRQAAPADTAKFALALASTRAALAARVSSGLQQAPLSTTDAVLRRRTESLRGATPPTPQAAQPAGLSTRVERQPAAPDDDRTARSGDAGDAADRGTGQGAPFYRTRLRELSVFLESGRLPLAAVGDGAAPLHEALLDDVLEHADDALWRIVALALEHEGGAARLLTQFPQRQLFALCATSAPGYAPALVRLVQRLAQTYPDRTDVCLRHALAACVARPALKGWPAFVYAKAALALDGTAAPSASIAYTPRRQAPPASEAVAWRASRAERAAARALVRLATVTAQWRARIDAADLSASPPAEPPAPVASSPGLVLRQRENMADLLLAEFRTLQALLAVATPGGDAPAAANVDDLAALRTAVAAQLDANPALAPQPKQLIHESILEKLDQAADPAAFLRGVLAALTQATPLDLDALAAQAVPNAAGPETPAHRLAAALKAGDAVGVIAHWQALLGAHGPQILAGVRHYCRNASVRRALAAALPDALVLDLAGRFEPSAPAILRALLTPSARLQEAVGAGAAWTAWTMRCRERALAALAGAAPALESDAFLRTLMPPDDTRYAALLDALPAQFAPGARPPAQGKPTVAPAPIVPMPADSTELLVVGNAGMVLAAPYLPRLFAALGLTADGKFVDETAAGRAVHLVQFMVTGQAQTPEYQLVLNKILCGLPTATPVPAGIDLTQTEQDTIEGMVRAMVAHAKVLGSSSVAAVRQTFFARTGDLQLVDESWQLRVHSGTFDVLLDRLPWSYSLIKFGWMDRPLHVAWRPT